jgi:uncharacterized protein YmfQ (DUF2313 family)
VNFYESIKQLFPRSKLFSFDKERNFTKFVRGLSKLPDDVNENSGLVYFDLFPETTRELPKWEKQFGVYSESYDTDRRRKILDGLWKSVGGGQTAEYLQTVLQQISPDIRVVENVPTKNPLQAGIIYTSMNKAPEMVNGRRACMNGTNKGIRDFTPEVIRNQYSEQYDIPADASWWEQCFFVCGGVVRRANGTIFYIKTIEIAEKYKKDLEYLILKCKPVQTTALMFVKYY